MRDRYVAGRWIWIWSVLLMPWPLTVEAVEEARYDVVEQDGDFEVRRYAPHIVAATLVEGSFSEVGNEGFRRLVRYIRGENIARQMLPGATAVTGQSASEKIAMTAPVNQQAAKGAWRITFLMPSQYTLATLPQPLDERIVLQRVPARLVASLRYSGGWARERFDKQRARLESLLAERGLRSAGEAVFARYNPPFMPWFLRRNEVLIPLDDDAPTLR